MARKTAKTRTVASDREGGESPASDAVRAGAAAPAVVEYEEEELPEPGHARMPLFLLGLWTVMILFFFYYFFRYGWSNLEMWMSR